MAQHFEFASYPVTDSGPGEADHEVNLFGVIIGILAYLVLVVPILSLVLIDSLSLGREYVMPAAVAWGIAGVYLAEKFGCRNLH